MSKRTAMMIAILVTAAWGSSFILMKNIAAAVPTMAFLTMRFGLASIFMLLLSARHLKRFTRRDALRSLILGVFLGGSMVLQVIGLRYTSASNSAFITSLSVLVVPFLSAVLLKQRPTIGNWVGVCLALLGLAFITGVYQGLTALNLGDALTFLCAACVAIHLIVADRFLQDSDPILLGTGQIVAIAVLAFIIWTVQTPQTFLAVTYAPALITSVVLTAVFCTCFAFTGQIVAQKYLEPSRVAVIFTLEPVFAYVYALCIPIDGVTETITAAKLVGCLLVLGGMMISESGILERCGRLTKG